MSAISQMVIILLKFELHVPSYNLHFIIFHCATCTSASQKVPVSGRSAPKPAKRSTVLLRSSELGPFSDTSPHR